MEIPCCGFTCPVEATLRLVGGKYKAVILWHLMDAGTLRYHELHRRIPRATDKMLAQQLRELERDGLLRRAVSIRWCRPRRSTASPTSAGASPPFWTRCAAGGSGIWPRAAPLPLHNLEGPSAAGSSGGGAFPRV